MRRVAVVVTCEHGGNRVPAEFRAVFASRAAQRALASHRGWDAGALPVARALARRFRAPIVAATVTRLLVDLNRSPTHRALHSVFSRATPADCRRRMLQRHYTPHRDRVRDALGNAAAGADLVVHVAVHSFTARLDGHTRNCDVGLLYDPARAAERELCAAWRTAFAAASPEWRVRLNYPYRGTADGLTTSLRREFGAGRYAGIELELNQRHVAMAGGQRLALTRAAGDALAAAISELNYAFAAAR